MTSFQIWLQKEHPDYQCLQEGFWKNMALAGLGLGIGAAAGASTHMLNQISQNQKAAKIAKRELLPGVPKIDVQKELYNDVKSFLTKKYGQEPNTLEQVTAKEFLSTTWGRRWPEILKTAQEKRHPDSLNQEIPDVNKIDDPVFVATFPINVLRHAGVIGICHSVRFRPNVIHRVCVIPSETNNQQRPKGEELRHTLQSPNFSHDLVLPDFPFDKIEGDINPEWFKYAMSKVEFWAKMGRLRNEYYRKTGLVARNGDANAMISNLLRTPAEYQWSEEFSLVFKTAKDIDGKYGTDYYKQLINIINQHLDQLVAKKVKKSFA